MPKMPHAISTNGLDQSKVLFKGPPQPKFQTPRCLLSFANLKNVFFRVLSVVVLDAFLMFVRAVVILDFRKLI